MAGKAKRIRRGVQWQMDKRRLEREARVDAIALVRWARRRGLAWERVAALLRVAAETLRRWLREWREDHLAIEPRGRPVERPRTEVRNQVLAAIGLFGPGVEIATLRRLFPTVARRELEDLVARYRRVYRRRGTLLHQLTWSNDGSVWAMDFTEAPTPIDAAYPYVLVVRDLGSGTQLLALPAQSQSAEVVRDALRVLFAEHGPPLVLKSDNGSGFVAATTQALLADHRVLALLSPPGTPEYNGACEAGIGGLKTRAHHVAARCGRPGEWTCDDVETARLMANETARPHGSLGPTPDELWAAKLPRGDRGLLHETLVCVTKEERELFRDESGHETEPDDEAAIERIALCRALIACGHLQLRRRRFSHPV